MLQQARLGHFQHQPQPEQLFLLDYSILQTPSSWPAPSNTAIRCAFPFSLLRVVVEVESAQPRWQSLLPALRPLLPRNLHHKNPNQEFAY